MSADYDKICGTSGALADIDNALLELTSLLNVFDYSLIDDGLGSASSINSKISELREKLNTTRGLISNNVNSLKTQDNAATGNNV